jgi:uncharacterized membrane protein
MPLVRPETLLSLIYIAAGGLIVILGVPLYLRWIPPNRFYGFRTKRTLADPAVWYPVNRVTGGWLAVTGTFSAGVATAVERLDFSLPAAATINGAVVLTGMVCMIVHSLRTLWRMK